MSFCLLVPSHSDQPLVSCALRTHTPLPQCMWECPAFSNFFCWIVLCPPTQPFLKAGSKHDWCCHQHAAEAADYLFHPGDHPHHPLRNTGAVRWWDGREEVAPPQEPHWLWEWLLLPLCKWVSCGWRSGVRGYSNDTLVIAFFQNQQERLDWNRRFHFKLISVAFLICELKNPRYNCSDVFFFKMTSE